MLIALLILLAFAISSCTTVRYVAVKPSPALTKDCDYPAMTGDKWKDLAEAYVNRGAALRECSDRMRAIREP